MTFEDFDTENYRAVEKNDLFQRERGSVVIELTLKHQNIPLLTYL